MATIPATIELNPSNDPQGTVIWLHGLGADGNDFVPLVEQLRLQEYKLRFVFPNAPVRPITINGGMVMRAWYDIAELNFSVQEDIAGMQASQQLIEHLIEREIKLGISSERIVLGGFSQGGAISLYTGLRYDKKLAGIIALSSYLPAAKVLSDERHSANQQTPIFMAHGLFDPVVPLMLGEMTRQQLQSLGYKIEWHTYPMPHTVLPEEIQEIAAFLRKTMVF